MPPHTTDRTTTNLKTKNNLNCQKIKLYKSPTTKELKKKFIQDGRRGRDGQPDRENLWQHSNWRTRASKLQLADLAKWQLEDRVVPYLCEDKPGGTTGEQDRLQNSGFQHGEIKPQTSD